MMVKVFSTVFPHPPPKLSVVPPLHYVSSNFPIVLSVLSLRRSFCNSSFLPPCSQLTSRISSFTKSQSWRMYPSLYSIPIQTLYSSPLPHLIPTCKRSALSHQTTSEVGTREEAFHLLNSLYLVKFLPYSRCSIKRF